MKKHSKHHKLQQTFSSQCAVGSGVIIEKKFIRSRPGIASIVLVAVVLSALLIWPLPLRAGPEPAKAGLSSIAQEKLLPGCSALLIGNQAYKDRPLTNPERDAKELGVMFQGSRVLLNQTSKQMFEEIRTWADQTKTASAFFYFSGFSMTRRDYGRDAQTDRKATGLSGIDMDYDALMKGERGGLLSISEVYAEIARMTARGIKVIAVMDACGVDSLTEVPPRGCMVIHSGQPGTHPPDGPPGGHSPMNAALGACFTASAQASADGKQVEMVAALRRACLQVSTLSEGKQNPWIIDNLGVMELSFTLEKSSYTFGRPNTAER